MFKPGQSGNPGGMPKLPESLRGIAVLHAREIVRIIAKYARMTHSELQEAIASSDGSIPAIEAAWAQQIVNAAYNGDGKALDRIMLWAVGAPQPQVAEASPLSELESMTTAELYEYIRAKLPPKPVEVEPAQELHTTETTKGDAND